MEQTLSQPRSPPRRSGAWPLLALAVIVAGMPALLGGFVYDDTLMIGHPMMDGPEDLLPAFTRNSGSFLSAGQGATRGSKAVVIQAAPTYRPLPMISLILVNATMGPRPFAHHVVSPLWHLCAVAALVGFCHRGRRVEPIEALVCGTFALHPALCEAWGWINGRSDVMAGAALLGVAALLRLPANYRRERRPLMYLLVFGLLVFGALCKETFLLAAPAVLLALGGARDRAASEGDKRQTPGFGLSRAVLLGLWSIAAAIFFAARAATLAGAAARPDVHALLILLMRVPKLLFLGVRDLLLPQPRPMLHLLWELNEPGGAAPYLLLGFLLLGVVLLLMRRYHRQVLLVLGAAATVLPAVLVADSFWMGFDRYLYLPTCLLALAALVARATAASPETAPRLRQETKLWLASAALLAWLGVATYGTAQTFRSQHEFVWSIVKARPEDPTGYMLMAEDLVNEGRPTEAGRALMLAPKKLEWPPAMAHQAARIYLQAGLREQAAALVEQAAQAFPGDVRTRFDLLLLRGAQHRFDEALELARPLLVDSRSRDAVRLTLRGWLASGEVPAGLAPQMAAEQ